MFVVALLLASGLAFTCGVKPVAPILNADYSITDTYDPNFDLIGDYVVNAYINDLDTLEDYSNSAIRPSSAICYINKDGFMTDKDGHSFDELYSDIYGWYLKDKMIPVFYISDDESADSIIAFYNTTLRYDMGVMSSNPALLSKVKEFCAPLHMIMDYSSVSDSDLVLKDMVAESNTVGANTIVISPSFATKENMFYMHARLKTVWVNDSGASDIEIIRQVTDGAYASLVDDPYHTIELVKTVFSDNSLNKKTNYNRPIMNIAHRGLCQTMWENSLEGCQAAYEKGATHIEIDIQVTKDKKLAIMHDDTIDRTTTGTGKISDYTAEELKAFKITNTLSTTIPGEGVNIPMLDEIFDAFKGTSLVIVVEIKTSDIYCVEILKDYLEEADIKDQVIVISFYTAQLLRMKQQIPDIPCADLNSYSEGGFMNSMNMLGGYNMVIDCNTANFSKGFTHKLAERGYAAWFWTYDNIQLIYDGMKKGVLGLTNNMADSLTNAPRKLSLPNELEIEAESFNDITIEASYKNYLNEDSEEKLEAVPIYIKESEDHKSAEIIFQAKYSSGASTPKFNAVLFSDIVNVTLKEPEVVPPTPTPSKNNTNVTVVIIISVASGLLIAAIPLTIIFVKRRKAK